MKASFTVAGKHQVEFRLAWYGSETYWVDGRVVLKRWSFNPRGRRAFAVGEGEDRHEVRIEVDGLPDASGWVQPGYCQVTAWVDDKLAVEDLVPEAHSVKRSVLLYVPVILLVVAMLILRFVVWTG